jgi:serine/threonine-protein kinase
VLAVNALPWAEVWIDGEHVGETPLGNLTRTIGTHEVVFRHPELGEKKQTITVTLREPARIGVDLRSKS